MIIETEEHSVKWEHWRYQVDQLPESWDQMDQYAQFDWLQANGINAVMLESEYINPPIVDNITIMDQDRNMNRQEWEIEVLHEPSGEYMTIYLGEELEDDQELTVSEVIDIIMSDISIIPRLIGA